MGSKYFMIAALGALVAMPVQAEPIPIEAASCPFETLMADEAAQLAAANTDGQYGLSAELEAAISAAVGTCTSANGWSAEVRQFSFEITMMAMLVVELEETLAAAGIPSDDYAGLMDGLSDAEVAEFAADASKTTIKAQALAKLAAADSAAVATHGDLLIQFLQGDAKGRLLGNRVAAGAVE